MKNTFLKIAAVFFTAFFLLSPKAEAMMDLQQIAEDQEESESNGPIDGQDGLLELKDHVENRNEPIISGNEFTDFSSIDRGKPLITGRDVKAQDEGLSSDVYQEMAEDAERDTEDTTNAVEDRGLSPFTYGFREKDKKVVSATSAPSKPKPELPMHKADGEIDTIDVTGATDVFPAKGMSSNAKRFELTPEVYYYKYTESIGVKNEGWKYGLKGTFTHHFKENEPIESWRDIFKPGQMFNVFKMEGRVSFGEVDYEGSGTEKSIPDYNAEVRSTIGYDIPVSHNLMFTPYGGIGYRYLYNEFSDTPAKVIDGQEYYSGYDRESKYLYLPLGVETELKMDRGWAMMLTGEFDYLIDGEQVSHLEDMHDLSGTNAGFDRLENDQKHGIGWRAGLKLTKATERFDWFNELFVRYWHIDDSEFEFVTNNGSLLCEGNLCQGGIEPDNETWEVGINVGAKF